MSFFSHRCMVKYRESIIFVDVFCLEHDLDALWSLLGSGFWTLWKRMAGSQWHWGLRCLASIFGIRLIIFVFGDFCLFKEIFCGNASHPVVAFVSVVPFVAFCGLLKPLGVFAWWFVVQSAASMDTAVFSGICDNYDIYGDTVGLQCISNLFLVIFTPFRGFSAKFGCFGRNMIFWFGAKRISWLFRWFQFGFEFWLDHFCFSVHLAALEGAMPNLQVKKFAGEKVPCQICRKKNSRWEDAIATLPVKRFFKVILVHHSPFGRRPWLQRYCWACVCNDIMVFHTSSRLVFHFVKPKRGRGTRPT